MKNNQESPELVNRFINSLISRRKSVNTINGYRDDLNLFFGYMINLKYDLNSDDYSNIDLTIADLDFITAIEFEDLESYTSYLMSHIKKNGEHYSIATIQKKHAAIRSFYEYLEVKAELIKKNPARKLESPKIEERDPIYTTQEESKAIIESAWEAIRNEKRDAIRDCCIITLFLRTGMRRAELASLNLSKIQNDIGKTIGKGNKENTKIFNEECLKIMNLYLGNRPTEGIKKGDEDAFFLSERKQRMGVEAIGNVVKKYATISGINKNKKITCHKLRHGFATDMLEKGVDLMAIKELLNHKSVVTTQIYAHTNQQKLREAVNKK